MKIATPHRPGFALALTVLSTSLLIGCSQAQPEPNLTGRLTQSWIANSFLEDQDGDINGPLKWVPDQVYDLSVSTDGTVFTAGYAEFGGGGASFKSGAWAGRYGGFNTGFGEPASVVAAGASAVYFGHTNGVQRFGFGGSRSPNASWLPGVNVRGLAVRGDELYVSDYTNNCIRVFSTVSKDELRWWRVERPGKIALDSNGRLWVIQLADDQSATNSYRVATGERVLSFTASNGDQKDSITAVTKPAALIVDNQNRLWIAPGEAAPQIQIFGNLGATPSQVATFGASGGIYGGTAGVYAPRKLFNVVGLGADGSGNIYIAMQGPDGSGQTVQAYNAGGTQLWDVHGLTYVDSAAIDPASDNIAYSAQNSYNLDWGKAPGREWSLRAVTRNPGKYPGSGRRGHEVTFGMRRIGGKLFLLTSDQIGTPLRMFRFNSTTDGEVAIPCAEFQGKWGAPGTLWLDDNGNGVQETTEVRAVPIDWKYYHVTSDGDVWTISGGSGRDDLKNKILKFPLQSVNAKGVPIYDPTKVVVMDVPGEFNSVYHLAYDKTADSMIVGGNAPDGDNGMKRLVRYDSWSQGGARVKTWDVTLPYKDASFTRSTELGYGGGLAKTLDVNGPYVFIAYGTTDVRIHSKDSGAYLGAIRTDINGWPASEGALDAAHGASVHRRTNGEYVIFVENAGRNHVVMHRWTPSPTTLRPPDNPTNVVQGVDYRYFEGAWDKLPIFSSLPTVKKGTLPNFSLSPRARDEEFGLRFDAFVEVPADGNYRFFTRSDDGSRLWIGDTLVVENDGLHGMDEQSGTIGLKAGRHRLRVGFFDRNGGEGLEVRWEGPGLAKQLVPDARLFRISTNAGLVNRATGGIATASSQPAGGEGAAQAFDERGDSKWLGTMDGSGGAWLGYEFGSGTSYAITRYELISGNDAPERDPQMWSLLGSNDGTTWTLLDVRSGQNLGARGTTSAYDLSNALAFKRYRLSITTNNGSIETGLGGTGLVQIAELRLLSP